MHRPAPDVAVVSPIDRNPGHSHGGITPVIRNVVNGLAEAGVVVDLLATGPHGLVTSRANFDERVRIVELPTRHGRELAGTLQNYAKRAAPSRILSAGHRYNLAALTVARRIGRRDWVVPSIHNAVSPKVDDLSWYRRRRRLKEFHRYRDASTVVAVSEGVREDFCHLTGMSTDAVRVVYNPVVTSSLYEAARQPVEHPWFGPESAQQTIVAIGRLHEQKGFDDLLNAFALVRERVSAKLVILGEGDQRKALESQRRSLGLEDCVDLPGFTQQAPAYLAQCQVFCLSSRWEGLSNAVVEALALSPRIVATDCPSGPGEILQGGRLGILVPVEAPEALAEALVRALCEASDFPTEEQREAGLGRFTVDTAIQGYMDALRLS